MSGFTSLLCALALAVMIAGAYSASVVSENCIEAICSRNDCKKRIGKPCTDGVCGPFYIRKSYWEDCGKPGSGYEACTKEYECSKVCVKQFLDKYAADCTYPKKPSCKDATRIHWTGDKKGCLTQNSARIEENADISWKMVDKKCKEIGGCD